MREKELTPPMSLEAEQSLLGGLCLDISYFEGVNALLKVEDFCHPQNQTVYETICDMYKERKPLDSLTVIEWLKTRNKLDDAGGEVYIWELTNNTPSAANVMAYAEIVLEKSILRKVLAASQKITASVYGYDGTRLELFLEQMEGLIFSSTKSSKGNSDHLTEFREVIPALLDHVDTMFKNPNSLIGLSTGYPALDSMTNGLRKGTLTFLAGRPSMGKSALCMNIVENVVTQSDLPVLVFNLEMSRESLGMRMLSSHSGLKYKDLEAGAIKEEDWGSFIKSAEALSNVKLYIDGSCLLSPVEMRSRVRRFISKHGNPGLVVVDYLQLMNLNEKALAGKKNLEVAEISKSLKSLAIEVDVPVIVISQLNRLVEQRADKRPIMSDLRDSGSIEQDADLILFLYREEVYNKDSAKKGEAELIIAKHRNGPTGTIKLRFKPENVKFVDAVNYKGMQEAWNV